MDRDDVLKTLETVYILPGDHLVFITARQFTPEVLQHLAGSLEKIFPEQQVSLVSDVATVLIERKQLLAEINSDSYGDIPSQGNVTGHYMLVKMEDEPPETPFLNSEPSNSTTH